MGIPLTILETARLTLRNATVDDAAFVLQLLNEPSFIRFIGDRGVRTHDAAARYIEERFIASYQRHGFGLWIVERKTIPGAIGISGLVKRDALPDPDIGFAFLPDVWRQGFACESAAEVKRHALLTLALPRLLAIINSDNAGSMRIVEKLGLVFERELRLSPGEPTVRLYTIERGSTAAG